MYTTWTILYELQRGVRIFMSILASFSFLCKDLNIVEAEKELT